MKHRKPKKYWLQERAEKNIRRVINKQLTDAQRCKDRVASWRLSLKDIRYRNGKVKTTKDEI